MNEPTEFKYPLDENGEPYFAGSHVNAIQGMEEVISNQKEIKDILSSFQEKHIQDTGWLDYQVEAGGKNNMYTASGDNGFKCGIRQIYYVYGNDKTGQRYVTQKMIRMNLEDFAHGDQVAQIPSGFTSNMQVFTTRSGSVRLPIMIRVYPNGKIFAYVDSVDQSSSNVGNRIYGQFEWTE